MDEQSLRTTMEMAVRRLDKWAEFQERHEREVRDMGRFPRELGPDIPSACNIKDLVAQFRRALNDC